MLGTPPAFILSQDQTLKKILESRLALCLLIISQLLRIELKARFSALLFNFQGSLRLFSRALDNDTIDIFFCQQLITGL